MQPQPVVNEESSVFLSQDSIQVHLRLPADGVYLPNALQTLREICEQVELPLPRSRRVHLAVEEALLNAFEHAYQRSDGFIEVQFILENEEFIVVVEDFGLGFDPQHVRVSIPEDAEGEQLLADRGRGHRIMNAMSDRLVIDSTPGRGTRTTLRFSTAVTPS